MVVVRPDPDTGDLLVSCADSCSAAGLQVALDAREALVRAAVGRTLDAQMLTVGPCGLAINCDDPAERLPDTFAKWALRGALSEVGAGYGIATPASLEAWGAPLGRLALQLPPSR